MAIISRCRSVSPDKPNPLGWLRVVFGLIALLMIATDAHAILRRSDRSEDDYIALGKRYPAVCMICSDGKLTGSGTLIAPRWVLTDAHVVDPWQLKNKTWVKSTVEKRWSVVFSRSQEIVVKRCIEYPGYANSTGGFDAALLELADPVEGIAPIPCYIGNQEVGRQITLVGFGGTGTFETGGPKGPAVVEFIKIPNLQRDKWAGTDIVIENRDKFFLTRVDPAETATELEAGFSGGDSGGPALIDVNGQTYVAGLIGWTASIPPGTDPNLPYGRLHGFHRVSYAARWIEDTSGVSFGAPRPVRTAVLVAGIILLAAGGWYFRRRRSTQPQLTQGL